MVPLHAAARVVSTALLALGFTLAEPAQRRLLQQSSAFASAPATSLASGGSDGSGLAFYLLSGGYQNFFLRDATSATQTLVTDYVTTATPGASRLVVATPADNNGALAWFNATNNSTASTFAIALLNNTLHSVASGGAAGVEAVLQFNQNATLTRAVVGSIRTVRDYVEGNGLLHPQLAHTVSAVNGSIVLHRQYLNGSGYVNLTFTPADAATVLTLLPDGNFTIGSATGTSSVLFSMVTNAAQLHGYDPSQLFAAGAQVQASSSAAQQAAFLTYREKFLAGGWRFLTFFSRDTLVALRLFMSQLAPAPIESALASVMDRLRTDVVGNAYQQVATNISDFIPVGSACHEETLGDYAGFVNVLQMGNYSLGTAPWYNYQMVDTDWLLLPSVAHYLLDLPQGQARAAAFLAGTSPMQANATYADLLTDNVMLALDLAAPFAENATFANLIHIRYGSPVGNWRDSNQGIGFGTIPFDINTALVPGALRAIQRLASAGIIDPTLAAEAGAMAQVWETAALPLFSVTIPPAQAQQLVSNYSVNVSVPLFNSTSNAAAGSAAQFYAVSLNSDGSQVPIMNSDLGATLLYADNVPEQALAAVPLLLSPFPAGLLTGVGMVVANPAYSANYTLNSYLGRDAYHGTVVWSWQQALMVQGLERQLGLCNATATAATTSVNGTAAVTAPPPAWCGNATLVGQLQQALGQLWATLSAPTNQAVQFSETWSWTYANGSYTVTPLGQLSPQGTESDAIQLWSYGLLGTPAPSGTATGTSAASTAG